MQRVPSVVYWGVAALVAWWASDALTAAISFLPLKEIAVALTPQGVLSKSGAWYLAFFAWTVVLFLLLRGTGFATALFTGPEVFGNVPIVRLGEGMVMELVIVTIFALPLIAALLLVGQGKNRMLDGMATSMGSEFAESAVVARRARLREFESDLASAAASRATLTAKGWLERLKDVFQPPENKGQGIARVQRRADILEMQQHAIAEKRNALRDSVTALLEGYEQGDAADVFEVREAVWEDLLASPWRFAWRALRHLWLAVLPLALILYVGFHRYVRRAITAMYEPPRRFFAIGRMGRGGSARFAGLIDEWALIYRNDNP